MLDELVFSPELHLSIQQIDYAEHVIWIAICSAKQSAVCSGCGMSSDRVHSEYERYPRDLPCMGQAVQLCAHVRRFFCDNGSCERLTFAEQFPCLLKPKARRTQRLAAQHTEIAFALGGEAGRRLCAVFGMSISGDTLIRAIRNSPEPQLDTPHVLGIDDWAKRKGQAYGSILVDLEARQPVDVLDSRTVEACRPVAQSASGDRNREPRPGRRI